MSRFFEKLSNILKPDESKPNGIGIASYQKGISLVDNRDYALALPYFDNAVLNGVSAALQERGICLMQLNFYKDAIDDFDKAIAINVEDANLYYCRAHSKHATGDLLGAIMDRILTIAYSQLKTPENARRDELSIPLGFESGTDQYMALTESYEREFGEYIEYQHNARMAAKEGKSFFSPVFQVREKHWNENATRRKRS